MFGFGFGFGLGFAESHCTVLWNQVGARGVQVSLSVSNLGERDTVQVVQCYVEVVDAAGEPVQVLRVPVSSWNAHGITGLFGTAIGLALLMIPRVLDLALVNPWVEFAKMTALVVCGAAIRLSWRPAGWLVQGFFLGQVLPMTAVAGTLYESSPTRVCNAYLLDDQVLLGQLMVWIAAGIALAWLAALIQSLAQKSAVPTA